MTDLKGKNIIVTGASGGIGNSIIEKLNLAGANILASGTRIEKLEELKAKHGNIKILKFDVSQSEKIEEFVENATKELGGSLDCMVNNAGITRDGMFHKMSQEQWRDVINVNLNGLFNMTHPLWDKMRARGFGRIVNISSINGQKGQLGQANYSAAKAGELGFTKSLALEGARKGITVNAICPGYINTDMVKAMSEKAIEATESQIPVGHLGEPEDIAHCVKFLVADESSFITGSTISANGGHYLI